MFSSLVDYSHRSAVFRAMRMPCGTDDLVGASLLAKTVFQSMHFRRFYRPFREQARSHRYGVFSSHVKNSTGPGCLQALWITHTGRLCFEPCEGVSVDAFSALLQTLSRANSLPQGRGVFEPCETLPQVGGVFEPRRCSAAALILWERACSRRRCFSRCTFGASTDPFASKLAPTGPGCFRAM
ncbi:hypothetical protein PsyrH_05685 [Pseudomonas syringae pv. syringae HS191]|nr:hypothetical protein PsyrH_05685 [Pseudomonas syringae pv. syringae HS191]